MKKWYQSYTILAAVASVLFAIGCATSPGSHPTKTLEEWYQDYSECEALAGQATGSGSTWSQPVGIVRGRVLKNCLRGKGWRLSE